MGKSFKGNYSCYDLNMKVFEVCSIILPILWGVLCSIMILRIFLGVDFTLVNVVLSAYKPVESKAFNNNFDDEKLEPPKEHPHLPAIYRSLEQSVSQNQNQSL